jgi:hypothetical protein
VKVSGNYDSPDDKYVSERLPRVNGDGDSKRAFTYFMLGSAKFVYASAARLAVIKAIASLSASADVLAMASVEVDLSSINAGDCITIKWRGKPVFVKHRTEAQIADVADTPADLRDVQADADRVQNPKWYARRPRVSSRGAARRRMSCPRSFVPHPYMPTCVRASATVQLTAVRCARVQADCVGCVHTPRLRAHRERGRLQRLVLPVPRLAL